MIRAVAPSLDPIREKVEAGVRLDAAEAESLWDERIDLHELGELANLVRERKNGNVGYYNINTHLNPTNVCVYRCTFCAFRADLRDKRGYVMSDEQILARGREAVEAGSTEMHIVGGLHHQKDYDWYLGVIRLLHDAYPTLHLKAWTPAEKQAIMDDFHAGRIDVLVCTSVIEVGIDVPNATVMTILDAESFGLSQLHQLRGRVARGAVAGICGAVTPSGTGPQPRVDAFVASTDGFELARKDFELRGAGNLVGTRQSGDDGLLVADLIDDECIMEEARADAHELFARDPALADPAHARLKKVILGRWGDTLGLGGVG